MERRPTLAGRTIGGRYRVLGLLGEGGMGSVYRAEGPDGMVAIKLMHAHLASRPDFERRFRREGKVLARLRGPNVIRVLDFGFDGARPYIAMEIARGRDLGSLLSKTGKLGTERAVGILLQLCRALAEAHGLGVVHRDLKPENLLLEPSPEEPSGERLKVLDFGIAKIVDVEDASPNEPGAGGASALSNSALTMVGTIVGTPEYMSPEQCRGAPLDARSDIYACGVILYELLTGARPIDGPTPVHVMGNQVYKAPRPPRELVPELDPALEALTLRMLAKDPAARPQSARELEEALAAFAPAGSGPEPAGAAAERASEGDLPEDAARDAAKTEVMGAPPVFDGEAPVEAPANSRKHEPASAAEARAIALAPTMAAPVVPAAIEPARPAPGAEARGSPRRALWLPIAAGVAVGIAALGALLLGR